MTKTTSMKKAILTVAALLTAAALCARASEPRSIRVKLAADRGIGSVAEWRIAAVRLLRDCFRSFNDEFGIKLVIEDVATWKPEGCREPLVDLLGEFRRKVPPGECDIVLGVMLPQRTDDISTGIASYPYGYVLVKNLASREVMVYTLLHELCHIFGAMDIREKGALMGIEDPGFAIDAFTARAVLLNRDRSFDRRSFPLGTGALNEAILLYGERAAEGRREPSVHLFLTLLCLEKGDLDAASRACAAATEVEPCFPGLHNLMGNICLFRGDYDLAVSEYRKALELQPDEPGIHFNLGLAYVQKGMLGEAAAEYQTALKIHPDYAEAALALDRIQLAGQDIHQASLAVKPFILALQKAW